MEPMVEVWGSLEYTLLSQEVGFEELKVVESDVEREPVDCGRQQSKYAQAIQIHVHAAFHRSR